MKVNLHIIRNIKYYLSVSIVLVVLSIVVFFAKGLNYGIDFTGGNLFQLKYNDNSEKKQKFADSIPRNNNRI